MSSWAAVLLWMGCAHPCEASKVPEDSILRLSQAFWGAGRSDATGLESFAERFADILRYHFRSKHFADVQAELPSKYMDWETQPSPWRTYAGAPGMSLPRELLPQVHQAASAAEAAPAPLTAASLGSFLRLSAGISAWKSYDGVHKWALRIAPSSGNLQTTELHLVLPALGAPLSDVTAVHHYQPEWHTLESRLVAPTELVVDTSGKQIGFWVLLTSLCVREAWKYGERALRSCHLNLGHALGAVQAGAELHGWSTETLPPTFLTQELLSTILGFPQTAINPTSSEEEMPEVGLFIRTDSGQPAFADLTPEAILATYRAAKVESLGAALPLAGAAGDLQYQQWPEMDAAARAGAALLSDASAWALQGVAKTGCAGLKHYPCVNGSSPSQAILRRRSVLHMAKDGLALPRQIFVSMLRSLCTAAFPMPTGSRSVHVLMMLHKVEGVMPGLYLLMRNFDDVESVRSFTQSELMDLRTVAAAQGDDQLELELGNLTDEGCSVFVVSAPADVKHVAQISACGQEIAGDGAMAAAFLGRFDNWQHPRRYPELLWEAGALGHVLYLAAEAAGFGATGIGCFFDDFTLALLRDPLRAEEALSSTSQTYDPASSRFQVLYHFSLGPPAGPDARVLDFEAYHHADGGHDYESLQGGVSRVRRKL